jgi:hypothetical protein
MVLLELICDLLAFLRRPTPFLAFANGYVSQHLNFCITTLALELS